MVDPVAEAELEDECERDPERSDLERTRRLGSGQRASSAMKYAAKSASATAVEIWWAVSSPTRSRYTSSRVAPLTMPTTAPPNQAIVQGRQTRERSIRRRSDRPNGS